MRHGLTALICAVGCLAVGSVTGAAAQKSDAKKDVTRLELTGCVSLTPGTTGQFGFVDSASGGEYRLAGKSVKKYAGRRVTLLADPAGKRPRIKLGLWPSPNVAAQAGALDPAQESIARQPGGAAHVPDSAMPELRVVRVQDAEGACR